MTILELFARIGLKADTAPAERFDQTVKGIKNTLIGAIAGTLSLATAVKAVNAAMGEATELKRFGDQTGVNVEEMQKWQAVAEQASGSGAAVASSIDAIVSNQAKIKLGTGNIQGYQLLGIDPRSDPFKVLEQIKAKTANVGTADKKNIIGMFGVNADLMSTLKLTNAEFDRMAAHAYVISPSMIEGLNKARGSISVLKNEVSYYVAEMATKLGPTIEKVSGFLEKFVKFIANGVMNIDKLVRSTIGLKAAIIAVAAVLAVMNAGFLTSPLGLFTIAIIGLMLVLDDLAAYNSGRGSLFGFLMLKFPGLMKVIKPISGAFKDIGGAIKALFGGDWSKFDEIIKKWGVFGEILKWIRDAFKDIGDFFKSISEAKNFGDWIGKMAKGGILDKDAASYKVMDQIKALISKGDWSGAWKTMTGGESVNDYAPVINNPKTVAPLTGSTTNNANMNMYVTITGGDPKETEFAVKKALLGGYQVVQASQAKGKAEKK